MVCSSSPYHFKVFKGCVPQILIGSFLNTSSPCPGFCVGVARFDSFINFLVTLPTFVHQKNLFRENRFGYS